MNAEQIVSAELFATILQAAHHPHVTEDEAHVQCRMQHVIHNGVLYSTPLRGCRVNALNKWSTIDFGKTAHWWVGAAGTACGRDFTQDIRHAYEDDPKCPECVAALAVAR